MPRSFHSLLLLLFVTAAGAQQAPSTSSLPADSGITLRTTTNLVVVDVVVTDKNGKPVHGMKESDFAIQENGTHQKIRNFEEHIPPPVTNNIAPEPKLPQGVFTNFTPAPPSNGPLNIVLFDTLNTATTDQAYVHNQVTKFLKDTHPGASFAVFALTNTHLALLQSFTSDPELLRIVLNSKKTRGNSIVTENPQTADKPQTVSEIIGDRLQAGSEAAKMMQGAMENMKQWEAETQQLELQTRARLTLNAMSQLARYLSNFSGRKNLIWFSGSFPVNVMADPTVHDPFSTVADSTREFQQTASMLARSQVAVYPVSAQGLVNRQLSIATPQGIGAPRQESPAQTQAFVTEVDAHATMLDLAHQTGGKAFVNTNDLAGSVNEAIHAGSEYYTLTYSPTDNKNDGKFRNIQVRLEQKGYDLAYRRGYYADYDQDSPLAAPPDTVHLAMVHGAPEPEQIVFKARVLPTAPATAPDELKLLAATRIGSNASKSRGPYRSYNIDCAVIPRTISFAPGPDGLHSATLELMTIAYNENGVLITSTRSEARIDLPEEEYARFLHGNLPLHQQISVPAKGTFYLRIGIYNKTNDTVGAIEVPIGLVKNLPPEMFSSALPSTEPDSQ